ncbi:prepilin-type N-terminal cleavage/methylation domain-containing protein [bacterium]|jgi:prepilin-type N-terminal cleavage/methylation domain-containing protein|nr:prepilin-type N-terminal cleavage/methylation domain-containing protein [bacterium]
MNKLIKQAFTLIELLVVIAIIGILSGLIVVSMSGVTQKANIAKAQVFSSSLRNSLMLDMVSEWKLDGGTIGNAVVVGDVLDSWSNNNATTIAGSPIVKGGNDCVSGNCIKFDGSSGIGFGNKAAFSMGTKDHTISLWVSFDNAVSAGNETLIKTGAGNSLAGYDGYWIYRYPSNGAIYLMFEDGTTTRIGGYLTSTAFSTVNVWYNIAVVMNRDGLAQAYINGEKQSGYSVDISTQQGDVQNSDVLSIGTYSSGDRLIGKMDEVRIFHAIPPTSWIEEQYYFGLNKLLTSGNISITDYQSRLLIIAKK